jgi:hypothetical protein
LSSASRKRIKRALAQYCAGISPPIFARGGSIVFTWRTLIGAGCIDKKAALGEKDNEASYIRALLLDLR